MIRKNIAISTAVALMSAVVSLPASANENPSCADGGTCAIGDIGPGGGVVFFVKSTGAFNSTYTAQMDDSDGGTREQTVSVELTEAEQEELSFEYLEAAPADGIGETRWANEVPWSSTGLALQGQKIGTGASGSAAMLSAYSDQNASINAAFYCDGYSNNGKSDWFLPSMDELALVTIRHISGAFSTIDPIRDQRAQVGSLMGDAFYGWTTTDLETGSVVRIDPYSWMKNYNVDNGVGYVLPIRAFSHVDPQEPESPESNPSVTAQKSKSSKVAIRLTTGSSQLTKVHRASIKKIFKKAGVKGTFVITGTAGRLVGISDPMVKALAKKRANNVKAYLVKLGAKKSHIKIKIKIYDIGITPTTRILARYLVS